MPEARMFAIAAVPFDDYDALDIADGPRWLLVRLARYADRDGRCFPSMRTLAGAAKKSLATVCRWLKQLSGLGCFTRSREAGRVYHYVLAEPYRLRWPTKREPSVSPPKEGVSHGATQEALPLKQVERRGFAGFGKVDEGLPRATDWEPRMRGWLKRGFWLAAWGPRPNEPGCWAPAALGR